MNYKTYKVIGKFHETNRKRTLKIEANSEKHVEYRAINEFGLLLPLEITVIPFDTPTESQLSYAQSLGITIPLAATKDDVSCLISRKADRDSDPNPGLVDFATQRNMFFSEYIGKKRLYNLVFNNLAGNDKTAFFIFSIYRWLSEDRHANLDTHPKKEAFYSFAEQVQTDTSFQKSLLNYQGEDLRFFGTITSTHNGISSTYSGGSNRTLAYKKASEFLNSTFRTPLSKTKSFNDHKELSSNRSNLNYNSDIIFKNIERENDLKNKHNLASTSGCLLPLCFLTIGTVLVFYIV